MASVSLFDSSADETLALVTAGNTRLYGVHVLNGDAATRYLQLFDAASTGAVTLGTTPPTAVVVLQASTSGPQSEHMQGLTFDAGLVYAVTTTATGSTGPTGPATLQLMYE